MTYTDDDHEYNCRVPDDEIRRALVELDKPWRSKRVLEYFHEERQYSTRDLEQLFGVNRSTIQRVVYDCDDFRLSAKYGKTYDVDKEQQTLGDYEEETVGLEQFV